MTKTQRKRKQQIDLPTKIILSDDGLNYFIQNKIAIQDLHTHEGHKKSGFHWESLRCHLTQRMFVNKLIDEIEIDRIQFLDKRIDIIDLTKLLIYGILYKKFRKSVTELFFECGAIQDIIKKGSHKHGLDQLDLKPAAVRAFVKENKDHIIALKEELLEEPLTMIDVDPLLKDTEKFEKKNIIRKFLDQLDNRTWFLYYFINKSKECDTVLQQLNILLVSFINRTKIADYVALMLLEVIQNFEVLHFTWMANSKKHLFRDKKKFSEIDIQDTQIRQVLLNYALQNNVNMLMNYKLDRNAYRQDGRIKLQITFRNKGLILDKDRINIQEVACTDTKEASLAQLYNEEKIDHADSALGMYYLSFLEEACSQEDIKFDSRITTDFSNEETLTLFILQI